jgi:hypothetical protein
MAERINMEWWKDWSRQLEASESWKSLERMECAKWEHRKGCIPDGKH